MTPKDHIENNLGWTYLCLFVGGVYLGVFLPQIIDWVIGAI